MEAIGISNDNYLEETFFCNFNHDIIKELSQKIAQQSKNNTEYIKNSFLYLRDKIIFGGDLWQVKASETLMKGYGTCYNKNLTFIALLRIHGIPCRLKANPMKKDFTRPSVGSAYVTFSNPFFHCFTEVMISEKWVAIDPTLDKNNYETFFKPLNVKWGIDWNQNGMTPLYSESIMGSEKSYPDLDKALCANLSSHFLFKFEPAFILRRWLKKGNKMMWKKSGNTLTTGKANLKWGEQEI